MKIIALFLVVAFVAITFVGCASPEGGSSIPWNRPQNWETGGIPIPVR